MTNRNKNILLGVLIVGVISMTIAFAALSTNLRINGTTNVAATRWNIHFQSWAVDTQSTITVGTNTQHNTAEYPQVNQLTMQDNTNVTKVSGINVTLKQPNDYARYTFQIINEGTIDADLQGFTHNMECESGKNCDFMEYEVKCYESSSLSGTEITQNSVLTANGGTAYCYLQVKYKDVSNVAKAANKVQANVAGTNQVYEQEAVSASLSAQWTWVQSTQANNQGGNQQGGGSQTPTNPYETTFDGDYTYKGDVLLTVTYDLENATSSYGDNECPEGYAYNNDTCYAVLCPDGYDRVSDNPGIYMCKCSNCESSNLENMLDTYLRTDGTTPEVCAVLSGGTVCMTSSYYNSSYSTAGSYASDFEDCSGKLGNFSETIDLSNINNSCLKGYTKAKVEEFLSKGVTSCDRGSKTSMMCDGTKYMIYANGSVLFRNDIGNYVSVNGDGSTN